MIYKVGSKYFLLFYAMRIGVMRRVNRSCPALGRFNNFVFNKPINLLL